MIFYNMRYMSYEHIKVSYITIGIRSIKKRWQWGESILYE